MEQAQANSNAVLSKALSRAQQLMGINGQTMASILGIDRTTLTRHIQKQSLEPTSNAGRLAILVLRVYRSVYALMGGDADNIAHWLKTPNRALNEQAPLEAMKSIEGLVSVAHYCDAMRGRN